MPVESLSIATFDAARCQFLLVCCVEAHRKKGVLRLTKDKLFFRKQQGAQFCTDRASNRPDQVQQGKKWPQAVARIRKV